MLLKELILLESGKFEGNTYYIDSSRKKSIDLNKILPKYIDELKKSPNAIGAYRFSDGSNFDFYTGEGRKEQRSFESAAEQAVDMYCREYATDYCRLNLTEADFHHRG